MIKKGTALCFATFILAGCGKDHTQGKFNRNEKCSSEYLEFLKKDCSDPVKKWIDYNKSLLLWLKIWEVSEIIEPYQGCKNTRNIEAKYKEITERSSAKFFGGEPLLLELEDIEKKFNDHWEKNSSIFTKQLSEYIQLTSKVSLDVSEDVKNFVKNFKEQVDSFLSNIKGKITTIRFQFVPVEKKDDLIKKIDGILDDFKNFCELGNFDKDSEIDFDKLIKDSNYQETALGNKIDNIFADVKECFIEMISRKIDNCPEDLKTFLGGMKDDIVEDEFEKLKDYEYLTSDDIASLIRDVNLSKLALGSFNILKQMQKVLGFEVDWVDAQGLKLKSDSQEIYLNKNTCGVVETKKFGDCEMIMKVSDNLHVLADLVKYIENCNVFKKEQLQDANSANGQQDKENKNEFVYDAQGNLILNTEESVEFDNKSIGGSKVNLFIEGCYRMACSRKSSTGSKQE